MSNKYSTLIGASSSFDDDGSRRMTLHPGIESEVEVPRPMYCLSEGNSVIGASSSFDEDGSLRIAHHPTIESYTQALLIRITVKILTSPVPYFMPTFK